MRYRFTAVIVVLSLWLVTVGIGSATASGPLLTRLEIDLSGTSDWQSLSISDGFIAAHFVQTQTPGTTVERGYNNILLKGTLGSAKAATVTVLMEVSQSASNFLLTLAKGKVGEAHAVVRRTNTTESQVLALNNYQTTGECKVQAYLSKSQLVSTGFAMPKVDPRRLVLAFYYPWFQYGSFDSGPWYDTPSGSYDTYVASEVAKQLDQAKGASVDGLVVSWDDVGNHTQRFDTAMAAAGARSMYVTPLIEMLMFKNSAGFDTAKIISTIKLALQRSTNPAFLSVNGRPVVFVFGAYQMGASTWATVKNGVKAAGYNPFFMGEPPDASYGFDGSYFYNPNLYSYTDLMNKNAGHMRSLRYEAQVNPAVTQKLWAATVSPGQNLSYYSPLFPKNEARKDGERYSLTWQAALNTDPEWVLITSWNEWYEATHIVPSQKFGSTALNQTAGWASGFHNPTPWGGGEESGGLLPDIKIPLKLPAPGK